MFKGKIKKDDRALLLELLKLMAETDGLVSEEEMRMILQIQKFYKLNKYESKHLSKHEILLELSILDDETKLNILTHVALLALEDKVFDRAEQSLFKDFFDLLSLESASKLQKLINTYGKEEFDVKTFYNFTETEEEVFEESLEILDDLKEGKAEDIDESKLMKMNKGPLKKIWDQVLKLYDVVKNPNSSKGMKALAIAALLYVILPFDAINDTIPVLGLTDDAAMVTFAITQLTKYDTNQAKALLKNMNL